MTVATNVHTAVLLDYLHLARDAEEKLAGLFARHVAGMPDGDYRAWLTEQTTRARDRAHDVDVRLVLLGETRGGLSATVGAVRRLADDALEVSTAAVSAGLDVVRRHPLESTVVAHARSAAVAVAETRAVYRAMAEVARAADDEQTTALAEACHEELTGLFTALDDALPALVVAALDAAESRPTYREAAETATRRVRDVAAVFGEDAGHAQHELRDTLDRLLRRNRQDSPDGNLDRAEITALPDRHTTRATEAAEALPIDGYDQLTAPQIIDRLTGLTQDQLAVLERYERAHADRVTVVDKIQALLDRASSDTTT
ncbi:hypothetical protein [Actinokineospora sp. HUAS TT18]|uniref:hypothetical protein n=1 Tax=Actinokineospora sp. HUAS TT18 TaxID=3447451 RepID=UPI003F51CE22